MLDKIECSEEFYIEYFFYVWIIIVRTLFYVWIIIVRTSVLINRFYWIKRESEKPRQNLHYTFLSAEVQTDTLNTYVTYLLSLREVWFK